jgi:hypothetical protein
MSARRYVAAVGGHYVDPKTGKEVRFEAGEDYNGPNPERCAQEGIVVPAKEAADLQVRLEAEASTENEGGNA